MTLFESWDTEFQYQYYLLNMSDNEFDERVDEVEELVAKLRANDRTVKSLCLDFETWEDVWGGNRNGDVKAKIDGDVVKLCRALED